MLRDIVVDDVADILDVEAASGNVGGDHDFVFAGFEAVEGFDAFVLGTIGVEDGDGVVGALEATSDFVGAVFGAAEDEDAVVVGAFEEDEEELKFLGAADRVKSVVDGLGGGTAFANDNLFGLA